MDLPLTYNSLATTRDPNLIPPSPAIIKDLPLTHLNSDTTRDPNQIPSSPATTRGPTNSHPNRSRTKITKPKRASPNRPPNKGSCRRVTRPKTSRSRCNTRRPHKQISSPGRIQIRSTFSKSSRTTATMICSKRGPTPSLMQLVFVSTRAPFGRTG